MQHDAAGNQILPQHDAGGSQILPPRDAVGRQFGRGESSLKTLEDSLGLKGTNIKTSYMGDLQYPSPKKIMYYNSSNLQSFFDSLLHHAAGSQTSNSNNSMNLKQKTKRFEGVNREPRWILLMGKTVGKKSGATVPLTKSFVTVELDGLINFCYDCGRDL